MHGSAPLVNGYDQATLLASGDTDADAMGLDEALSLSLDAN